MAEFVSTAQNVIKQIDKSKPEMTDTTELLDTLMELADTQKKYLTDEIKLAIQGAGQGTDTTAPVVKSGTDVIHSETHAVSADSADHIADGISNALKNLFGVIKDQSGWDKIAGASLEAFTTTVNTLIDGFIGKSEGRFDEAGDYHLLVENDTLVRIDMRAWQREVKSQAITSEIQSVAAFAYTKSVVDIKKIDPALFRLHFIPLVKECYPDKNPIQQIKECDKFFTTLGGIIPSATDDCL